MKMMMWRWIAMEKIMNKQKDPLIHIVKRDQITIGKIIGIKVYGLKGRKK